MTSPRRPRVVIVGGGFGGHAAARRLRREDVDITVIDRTNHHIFQPLLYQVATATLASTEIIAPIRYLLRDQANTRVLLGEVRSVDPGRKLILMDDDDREIPYDYLILAAGARHSYFAHPEWEELAPGLKSVEDALEVRRRFLLAFELAEKAQDDGERQALLTFVIVGGGPTGVELAGMIPTIASHTLAREFRSFDATDARVILLEAGPRVIPTLPERLSARALDDLRELGVDVRTNTPVTGMDERGVQAGDEWIAARTVLWAAGNASSPLGGTLGTATDRAGRVIVTEDLSVPGHPELFVVGDMAAVTSGGRPVPGVAPAAVQGGNHAARMIIRDLRNQERHPFRYVNKGDLATIGRRRAVADLGRVQLTGTIAWLFWLFIHILYLAGFRNRLTVLVEWAYAYFTYARGARLITEPRRRNPPPDGGPAMPGWK